MTEKQTENAFPRGIYKVVKAEELENWTRQGWELVTIVGGAEESIAPREISQYVAGTGNNNGYYQPSGWQSTQVMERVIMPTVRYLLRKLEVSVIAEQGTEIAKLQEAIAEAKRQDEKWKRQLEEKTYALEHCNQTLEEQGRVMTDLNTRLVDLRSIKQRMEGDLGKVRQAVGELRMKEILGS